MSKFCVSTKLMQELIGKALKGASNNKMFPLSSMLNINLHNGRLAVTASDAITFITTKAFGISGDEFDVVISTDKISKLMPKITSDNVTFTLNNGKLKIKGNGEYDVDVLINEEGDPLKYPMYSFNNSLEKKVIKLSAIKSIIQNNKPSLSTAADAPYLSCYYCGTDKVISADSFNICINKVATFDTPMLIQPRTFDLLALSNKEEINYQFDGRKLLFTAPDVDVYSTVMEGIENYPIDSILDFLNIEYNSNCIISKSILAGTVDRITIFNNDFDISGIFCSFTTDGINVESNRHTSKELITYKDSQNFVPYECFLGADNVKKALSAINSDTLNIYYGDTSAVKVIDGDVVQIIAVLEDDKLKTE